MMLLPVTALHTALALLLLLALAANVVRRRISEGVSLGDGGNRAVQQAMRAHANAAEYIPVVLIGLALLELGGTTTWVLVLYGSFFLLGRLLHAHGMTQPRSVNRPRQFGILLSWIIMVAIAFHLLAVSFAAI